MALPSFNPNCRDKSSARAGPHLDATLTTPITQASRIPLSNHDSEFMSTMAPTLPNVAVQSRSCRKTWEMEEEGVCKCYRRVEWRVCACACACTYPVSVEEPQAARAGANPLLLDVVEHVDEQRAVHLVGQVDGRVTLETRREEDRTSRCSLFTHISRYHS